MYNVNVTRIEEVLSHLEQMLVLMKQITAEADDHIKSSKLVTAALERALHLSIEAIADVGNALIDGFIMRDPGSYTDIVEILADEQVIGAEEAVQLGELVSFRKQLVNEYTTIPVDAMILLVRKSLPALTGFAPAVRRYVEKELF
ncbi:DUF86 domain-containing protein [Brevibacillus fulvus]|uniref:Uncharacterized protein YutE (UPF0331/DUF86 family) n=1 Tax=Brevibacillus fulvus TaxID=1125967 RepID=A0A938Y166_9BACL|nr:DUF86 domain-containing protein [Brevibacillus fulvus]MBM7592029.1 uncharacterized protein YutE (UPF0331/DUF86 family) [Brevibacillus fulvus]